MKSIAPIFVVAAVLISPQATARDFIGYQSTTPLLYRYGSCIFAADQSTAEGQIENCAKLKAELEQQSEDIVFRFHRIERSDVRRELRKGFDEIEKDAFQTRKQNKPVPASIVSYLGCMGENVMQTADYRNGDAISYIGVEDSCFSETIDSVKGKVSDREQDTIDALYRRFNRFGRLTYPTNLPANRNRPNRRERLAPVFKFDRSFLNLSLVRKHDGG